jgi:carbamoyltransferase
MRVLGIIAIFHGSSAALVADGQTVSAAGEDRFSRRMHGLRREPFMAWEPERTVRWGDVAGLRAGHLMSRVVPRSRRPMVTYPATEFRLRALSDHLRRIQRQDALSAWPTRCTGSISRLSARSATILRTPLLLRVSCASPVSLPARRR